MPTLPLQRRLLTTVVLVLLFVFAYFAFREIYPPDSFFVAEFTSNSRVRLSPSARVVYRRVDPAPRFADYNCEALIEVDAADFAHLSAELKQRQSTAPELIVRDTLKRAYPAGFDVAEWVGHPTPRADWLFWELLRDGKTLFFYSIVT